jgi:hypothetical protein
MRHYDYEWDLYPNYMKLDKELPVNNLGWNEGDIFQLVTVEGGTKLLRRLDPIEKFARGYSNEKI